MPSQQQNSFFAALAPFNLLPKDAFDRALAAMDILYFSQGEIIFTPGDEPGGLFIILKGLVKEESEEGSVSYYHQEDDFDPRALLSGQAQATFTVEEETICYSLPKAVFLDLCQLYPSFGDFFSPQLSAKRESASGIDSTDSLATMFATRIRDLDLAKPVVLAARTSIRDAARTMRARKIDAILVSEDPCYGILTSADIRDALAIEQMPVTTPIGAIASWKLVMAAPDDPLIKALLIMTKRGLIRLAIGIKGKVMAILTLSELLSFLNNHAFLVIQRIHQATTIEALIDATSHQEPLIRSLYSKGVKVRYISRLIRELDRHVFQKAAHLMVSQDVLHNMCLLVMGSEGRGEQITKTDQDNALIADDSLDPDIISRFRYNFTETLIKLGYPPCPGNVMMCNPQWSGTLSQFQETLRSWINNPTPTNLMQLATFYDSRAVVGRTDLWQRARNYFLDHLPDDQSFYAHFAKPMLSFDTPLGMFNRFIVEKGAHPGMLELKKGGIFPIVHGVRTLALEQKIKDPNTSRRIRALVRLKILDKEFGNDLIEAFDFMSGLRLRGRLDKLARNESPDDYLLPPSLGRLEREILRDSLRLVDRLKQFVSNRYHLGVLQ
ncbi:MAG: cyclic nucleotide-binding/CBS domain-containing protein [Magnetococcales bacterium]|nr:cyclic nucleotide-binding/CBS domain-containing protein [Magnetococcales bacterium]NGZ26003.1 cyclic nucleotide-binding/CBS domain-containing protein [Magnetococcales bacterium]